MSSAAIERRDEQIDSLRNRLSNIRKTAELESREIMSTGAEAVTAYAYGAMERRAENRGTPLASLVDGVPTRLSYGVAAYVAGRFVGGDAGLIMQAGGKALITVHAYLAGRESVGASR
jgi:hypothetical protein